MSEQVLGAKMYLGAVKSYLSEMVRAKVFVRGEQIVISTREFGEFISDFDVWEKMIYAIPSKDTADAILRQYKHFVFGKMFK